MRLLNAVYAVLCPYQNYFQPSVKLLQKERDGAKVRKIYDTAKTPYCRLIRDGYIPRSLLRFRLECSTWNALQCFVSENPSSKSSEYIHKRPNVSVPMSPSDLLSIMLIHQNQKSLLNIVQNAPTHAARFPYQACCDLYGGLDSLDSEHA